MFVRELTIQNLRSIQNLHLEFVSSDGKQRKWTLLLGENGCGKSTVLRAAALVFAGSDALAYLLGNEVDSWIRFGTDEAVVSAVIVTAEAESRSVELRLRRGAAVRQVFDDNRESLAQLDAALSHATRSYLTVGYGAARRLNSDPHSMFKSSTRVPERARAVATLFSPDAALEPLESWVIDMDYRGKKKEGEKIIRQIAEELMPHVEFHGIDKVRKQLLFKTPDGITPLTQLSDGYQNVAAWCGDLLRSITTTFKDYENPLQARGLLLVDEIDLHLHPVWQRRLRVFFDKTFPNLQFLATTHSPLTVQQAGEGELYVMRRTSPKAGPTLEAFEGAPNTMMIHQLLLSPIFNLESIDSLVVQKKRQRYRTLKKKANRSPQDDKRLQTLKRSIEDLPDLSEGLTKYKKRQTKVLSEIHKAIEEQGENRNVGGGVR